MPAFKQATNDKFFICIEAADPKFNLDETEKILKQIGASSVVHVEE